MSIASHLKDEAENYKGYFNSNSTSSLVHPKITLFRKVHNTGHFATHYRQTNISLQSESSIAQIDESHCDILKNLLLKLRYNSLDDKLIISQHGVEFFNFESKFAI